jgi:hypothetical protein
MNQLLNPAERQERIVEKRTLILRLLRDETYTHIDIIRLLINVNTTQAAHQTLNKMVRDNLLKKAKIDISYGRPITLFGITNNGLAHAFTLDEKFEVRASFQPSKVKPTMLKHKLAVQQIIVKSTHFGYSNVENTDLLNLRKSGCKVPDLIAEQNGKKISIEVELSIKSIKRYSDIIIAHLLSMKAGHWHEVHYLLPSNDLKARLERIFRSIETVQYKNQSIKLTEKHFSKFKFFIF